MDRNSWVYIRRFITFCLVFLSVFLYQYAHANSRALYQKAISNYDRLLMDAVTSEGVDYAYIKKNQFIVENYLYVLSIISLNEFQDKERVALLINAYNVFTMRLILDYWPKIKSIKDIPDYPIPRRWKDKRWNLGGQRISLKEMKQKHFRELQNPMIHMALVDASKSGPDLLNGVYNGAIIHQQLDTATRRYLSQKKGLQWRMASQLVGEDKPVVYVSEVFRREETDFFANGYEILDFIGEFAPHAFKQFISDKKEKISLKYLSYDWQLNLIPSSD